MSIQIGDNLSYYGKKFNFQRDAFTTLSEMKSFNENYIPEKGFKAYCAETDKYYVFSVTSEIDLETGKWREYKEILDNLESNDSTKALSANQGKLLKENIDLKEDAYNKGRPNGYAPLDSAGKVPLENTYGVTSLTEIDEALDTQSTNPVQNKVIKEALVQMDTRFAAGMNIDTETNILSLLDAVGNVLGTAQLPSGGGGPTTPEGEVDGSTLGGLTNVNDEVDVQDAQDVFLVKSAGSDKWGKRNVKDFTGKDGVIAYPTMFLNPLTGRLILQVPTNNYENRFAVRNGHLMLIQS